MSIRNTTESYGSISQLLHWLIAIFVLFMIFLGYFMDDVTDKVMRGAVVNIHKLTGLAILVLMVLRLVWAFVNPKPTLPEGTYSWEKFLERLVHYLLYALLIVMPISGWVMSVAAGKPPHLLSFLFTLPIDKSKDVAELSKSIHNTLAIVIIVMISLHALAALYHHFVKKDNVLKRMMPN